MVGSRWTCARCRPCPCFVVFYRVMWASKVIYVFVSLYLKRLALTLFHWFRACALLGSLECVHGAVDKGISLLEQAAAKVYCQSMCAIRDLLTRPLSQGVCDAHLELGLHFHAKDPRARGGGGLTNAEQVYGFL
jgi:hypothetical protein